LESNYQIKIIDNGITEKGKKEIFEIIKNNKEIKNIWLKGK
jgi:hypothetical protein